MRTAGHSRRLHVGCSGDPAGRTRSCGRHDRAVRSSHTGFGTQNGTRGTRRYGALGLRTLNVLVRGTHDVIPEEPGERGEVIRDVGPLQGTEVGRAFLGTDRGPGKT
jgi:hypothetical protein